jgi:hypothetical protein
VSRTALCSFSFSSRQQENHSPSRVATS